MKVLVVGRGGREHSIMTHLAKSPHVSEIYAAPGNGGMAKIGTCVELDEMDIDGLVQFAKEKNIHLTVVGPEAPLNAGIANRFLEEGLAIFAPTKEAALLEGSKQFAKDFMKRHNIPTAAYETFTDAEKAKAYIKEKGAPIVIKADGLAEGKGVIVAMTEEEALDAVDHMLVDRKFSKAGDTIVIEEFLEGEEFSLMAFVDGNSVYPMIAARDYKRAYDNDEGLNTGGMGSFAPVPYVTEEHYKFSVEKIIQVVADKLVEENRSFTGILYAGLMLTKDGPKVIEFNTRFGDPETQVVLPLLENDLFQVFVDVLDGKDPNLRWKNAACAGVVVASKGYPERYAKGKSIPEINTTDNTFVIEAGTIYEEGVLKSNGGRVLLVGAVDKTISEASTEVYKLLEQVDFKDNFFYRNDIGKIVDKTRI